MKNLFFYGTLRYQPLLTLVLGDGAEHVRMTPARLADHAVYWAKGQAFPMIVAEPGATAQGLLAEGLRPEDIARLNYYEGGFAYDLHAVPVEAGARRVLADVYFPEVGKWAPAAPWSLDDWLEGQAAMSMHAAREVMGYYGQKPPTEVARMFPMIRARAASRARAEAAPIRDDAPQTAADVEVLEATRVHAAFFATDEYRLRHRTVLGGMTPPLLRTAFVGVDSAVVLPYDPVRDRVLLVEQFRVGAFVRGDADCWMLEPVAGMVDAGETPEQAAHREMMEEAGVTARALLPLAEGYPTPGAMTEYHYHFVALCDLPDGHAGTGGLASEHEDLRILQMSFDAAMDLLAKGSIHNVPLILSLLSFARIRDGLRQSA